MKTITSARNNNNIAANFKQVEIEIRKVAVKNVAAKKVA